MDIRRLLGVLLLSCLGNGCGVKGDPLPPEKPPHLGRGRPDYQRAAEEFAYPNLPPVQQIEGVEDEEDKEAVEP